MIRTLVFYLLNQLKMGVLPLDNPVYVSNTLNFQNIFYKIDI